MRSTDRLGGGLASSHIQELERLEIADLRGSGLFTARGRGDLLEMLNLTVLVVALFQAGPSAACEVYGDEAASACRAGVSKCCARAAVSLIHRRPDRCEGAPNPLLAARLATMGCDGGDGVSCSLLAAEAERKTPGFPPPHRSSALWNRGHELGGAACGGGDAEACLALARSAREGVSRTQGSEAGRSVRGQSPRVVWCIVRQARSGRL